MQMAQAIFQFINTPIGFALYVVVVSVLMTAPIYAVAQYLERN